MRLLFSALVALFVALGPAAPALVAQAHGLEQSARYGACFDYQFKPGQEHFDYAVAGRTGADIATNDTPHWHFNWLIQNGTIQSLDDVIGKCAFVSVSRIVDDGGEHHYVYLDKGEVSLQFVTEEVALNESLAEGDNYCHLEGNGCDKNLVDKGSTCANRGRKCDME